MTRTLIYLLCCRSITVHFEVFITEASAAYKDGLNLGFHTRGKRYKCVMQQKISLNYNFDVKKILYVLF